MKRTRKRYKEEQIIYALRQVGTARCRRSRTHSSHPPSASSPHRIQANPGRIGKR